MADLPRSSASQSKPLLGSDTLYSAPATWNQSSTMRDSARPGPMTRGMSRSASEGDFRVSEGDSAETSDSWTANLFAKCCGPRKRHTSRSRTRGEVWPHPGPHLPVNLDLSSPEGAAFAQLAGGAWVSQLLLRLWPNLASAAEKQVADSWPGLVESNTPAWMQGVTLDRFSLGSAPPVVRSVHVDPVDDDGVGEVRVQLEVEWASSTDVQLTVQAAPQAVAKFTPDVLKGALNYVTSLTAGVRQLVVRAHVLLTLTPLADELPVVRAVQVCLLKAPHVDFTLTLTRGQSHILNVFKPWVASTIAAAFAPLVMPEHIHIPIDPSAPDTHKPEGLLQVQVVRARDVPRTDYMGWSDPYVDLWTRGRVKRRTPVIKNTANPEWPPPQSSFNLLVASRQYQSLTLELWDEDKGMLDANDDLIGTATVALRELKPGQQHTLELQVFNSRNQERLGVEGDAANAGGTSRADVTNTRLTVEVRYIPATMAATFGVGAPGVLSLQTAQLHVPDLGALPLKAKPYVRGQQPAAVPPLSPSIKPMTGKDAGKLDIPWSYNAVWDVLGGAEEVECCCLVIDLLSKAGSSDEAVEASFELPLPHIMSRHMKDAPGGISGGEFVMSSASGFTLTFTALFHPLCATPAPISRRAASDVGLQSPLHAAQHTPACATTLATTGEPAMRHSASSASAPKGDKGADRKGAQPAVLAGQARPGVGMEPGGAEEEVL